jgi:hypothetical protein
MALNIILQNPFKHYEPYIAMIAYLAPYSEKTAMLIALFSSIISVRLH